MLANNSNFICKWRMILYLQEFDHTYPNYFKSTLSAIQLLVIDFPTIYLNLHISTVVWRIFPLTVLILVWKRVEKFFEIHLCKRIHTADYCWVFYKYVSQAMNNDREWLFLWTWFILSRVLSQDHATSLFGMRIQHKQCLTCTIKISFLFKSKAHKI